jgi:hypothetical protein
MTHGAILLPVAAETGKPPQVTAREEAMAPTAAAAVATRNNEQKMRRHRDGENFDVMFGFVIIKLPVLFGLVGRERTPKPRS